jgi:hypothetical protein
MSLESAPDIVDEKQPARVRCAVFPKGGPALWDDHRAEVRLEEEGSWAFSTRGLSVLAVGARFTPKRVVLAT